MMEFTPAAVLAHYPLHADTLPSLVASRALTVPNALALRFGARIYTYAELTAAVSHLARVFSAAGAETGTPIGFIAPNSDLTVLAFLAAGAIGAVFVPMNAALTDAELKYVIEHSRARILCSALALKSRVEGLAQGLAAKPRHLALDDWGLHAATSTKLIAALHACAVNTPRVIAEVHPEMPLVVVYTSGTTGFPKGVVHTHRNYVWAAEAFVERMHLQPTERLLTVLPFFHINALFYSLGGALAAGAMLIAADSFSASRFWDLAVEAGATQFNTLAAVGSILCKRPRSEFNPAHRIRKVYGGPISPEVDATFRAEFNIPHVIEGYGMSEIPGACNNPFQGPHKQGSIGVPARHPRFDRTLVQMRVDDDEGQPVPTGSIGELVVKTPIALQSYLHDPQATATAFRDGWFLTGDLARQDEEGYFYFIARKKDIIRVRGENVAGAELDRILGLHPAISEAATIGVPAELGDEEIFAVLVARDRAPEITELIEWCRASLAEIKIPRYWLFVDSLPHTPSHRVQKHRLKSDPTLLPRAFDRRI